MYEINDDLKSLLVNFSLKAARDLIRLLESYRVNTLTELCQLERTVMSTEREVDARALQEPMEAALRYYVTSHRFFCELRGLTPTFPFSGELVAEAHARVVSDPESRLRSWNLPWLCLVKMKEDGLLVSYANFQAHKPEMWDGMIPSQEQLASLVFYFQKAWSEAVETMLRNWDISPTWSYRAHWRVLASRS
ncbi:uncharacterized protein J7T54_003070 [Emericellopsis cladophorae]|uniref:Uncharacterized protein n=1 Tax=Emericellopsis cladophorae TaxID=2686198 RepID=A0A9P9XZS3_9HYPO|nr:uncharacterized protein J7T54_003070 [Emericellopsis cladophorae]KAI6780928.1 hypothetical protein J7T54_003070 [Emericellopsis cladophorae]